MKTAIGAYCQIEWKDLPGDIRPVFISFADDCAEEECDAFGTHDSKIFFFCPGGEEELKGLVGDSPEDFVVHSYEVQWKS